MRYELIEISGGCLDAFDCRDAALEVLLDRATSDPENAREIVILEFDDDLGEAIGFIEIDPEVLAVS